MKKCKDCGIEKDESEYHQRRNKGYEKVYLRTVCNECWRKKNNEYSKQHRERIADNARKYHHANKDYERYKQKRIDYRETLHGRFIHWRIQAKSRKIEFSITENYLNSIPRICFYTGEELTFKQNQPNTISLDRLDSSKGYIEGNVVFTSWRINQSKNDLTIEQFMNLCKKVVMYKGITHARTRRIF